VQVSGVVCCGLVLGTCAECKRTKSKCDKSRGKGKVASDEKGKAPGKLYYSSPAFLDSSTHATKVRTTRRQKDPFPFELSDLDNMEMESPVAQGKRKAEPRNTRRATRSPVDLPHTAGFAQTCASFKAVSLQWMRSWTSYGRSSWTWRKALSKCTSSPVSHLHDRRPLSIRVQCSYFALN
jgi:hypothetical protein